jgi:hypothetical protein
MRICFCFVVIVIVFVVFVVVVVVVVVVANVEGYRFPWVHSFPQTIHLFHFVLFLFS